MDNSLVKIEESLQSLDMTRVIEYTRKIQDIGEGFNTMLAPIYLRDFILAIDITGVLYAKAIKNHNRAEAYAKRMEAIAFMDKAGDALEERGLRNSAEARKKYVPMDPDVIAAHEVRAKTEAMVSLLRLKLQEFRLAHDDVKKIAYFQDYNNTEYEGM